MKQLIREDETLDDLQLNDIYLIQKKEGFRFGVDAVLLANFTKPKRNSKVIDFCSGTGIIPFIIAGKTDAKHITGIEIQEPMVEMANRSVKYNNLQEKIEFICMDLKDKDILKKMEKVDVVTVNPPYKTENTGIINPKSESAIARHEIMCNLEDVIVAARTVLKDGGRMFMVHRPERIVDILYLMRKYKMEPKRIQMVHPTSKKAPNIMLIEAQRDGGKFLKWDPDISIYNEDGSYTDEINKIYGRNDIIE
jgi:tRNA1(Val) A37 N6-methylase TrmN6